MSIKAKILAGALGLPLLAGTAFAAETKTQGAAALIAAAERNDAQMIDRLLGGGADPKAANEFGATALYAAAGLDPAALVASEAAGTGPAIAARYRMADSGQTPTETAPNGELR